VLQPSLVDPAYRDPTLGSLDDLVRALVPHVRLLTPNARELGLLAKCTVTTVAEAVAAASLLASQLHLAVLVKAGHLGGDATDILVDGATRIELAGTRISDGEHVHGTGCALATAIAARLALGDALEAACREAKRIVAAHIANPIRPGRGAPAVV
jgi:hydroxymethylpyrimidine kinase/phosphomethylpyrimidine kinase